MAKTKAASLGALVLEEARRQLRRVLPATPKARKRELDELARRLESSGTVVKLDENLASGGRRKAIAQGIALAWAHRALLEARAWDEAGKLGKGLRLGRSFSEPSDRRIRARVRRLMKWAREEPKNSRLRKALKNAEQHYLGRIVGRRWVKGPLKHKTGGQDPAPSTLIAIACDQALTVTDRSWAEPARIAAALEGRQGADVLELKR